MWDSAKIVNSILSIIGIVIAVCSLIFSIYNTNEQTKLKRQINYNTIYALISYYRIIVDFHDFVDFCFHKNMPLQAQTIVDFYRERLSALLKIRSTPEYHLYVKALRDAKDSKKLQQKDIEAIEETVSTKEDDVIENLKNANMPIGIATLEDNMWWSTMDTLRRLSDVVNLNGNYPDEMFGEASLPLLKTHDRQSLLVIRVILHFENRAKIMLYLLTTYEDMLTGYVEGARS
jgi:hypothetical protein